jgi:hypothetical protein
MYALIETNNATHIAINIPLNSAEKSLPALAAMLENNAVFIQSSYYDCKSVTPSVSFMLGQKIKVGSQDTELVVCDSGHIISDDFVIERPEVHIINAAAIKKKDEEIKRCRTEIDMLKLTIDTLKERIDSLENDAE